MTPLVFYSSCKQIEQLVKEMSGFSGAADLIVKIDLKEEDLVTASTTLSDESKKLPKLRVSMCVCVCVW